jgi:hypothetical protein
MTWTDTTFHSDILLTFGLRFALHQEGELLRACTRACPEPVEEADMRALEAPSGYDPIADLTFLIHPK